MRVCVCVRVVCVCVAAKILFQGRTTRFLLDDEFS